MSRDETVAERLERIYTEVRELIDTAIYQHRVRLSGLEYLEYRAKGMRRSALAAAAGQAVAEVKGAIYVLEATRAEFAEPPSFGDDLPVLLRRWADEIERGEVVAS